MRRLGSILDRLRSTHRTEPAPSEVPPSIASMVSTFERVEKVEREFYRNYLRAGMTVLDAGANVGEIANLFASLVAPGTVHAFEPATSTFAELARATEGRNVVANHLALADVEKTVTLEVFDGPLSVLNSTGSRPLEKYGIPVKPIAHEEVRATTVDAYCETNNIELVDLLKIDVEGGEYYVMLGARRMLAEKRIRCVVFEFGTTTADMGIAPEQIEDLLRSHGYSIRNLTEGEPLFPGREGEFRFAMHVAM